ncbi:MAG: ABC transporter permease subunit [Euryarchaeota archaeon]|nr:ABC transporter permease subunit [Euryarchaeota archaeon]
MSRRRLALVVVLATLLPIVFYAIPPLFDEDYPDTANEFASRNLLFISTFVVISAAMFAGDSVVTEFEKRTGLSLFSTPQRRTSIFAGKYIAALLATWLAVACYYLVTALEIGQIYGFGEISLGFAKSFLISLLYASAAVSFCYFFSCLLKKSITAMLAGFFVLMMILPIVSQVLNIADVDPWFILTYNGSLITDVLGILSGSAMESVSSFSPDFYVGVAVVVAYGIVFFYMALFLANRKAMEG